MKNIPSPTFLSRSEFQSPLHSFLNRCVHRTTQANFFFAHDTNPDIYNLLPQHHTHAAHTAIPSDTSTTQTLPYDVTSGATFNTINNSSTCTLSADGWGNFPNRDPSEGFPTSYPDVPVPPPGVPYSDHITTVNATEAYGVPLGMGAPINQTAAPSSGWSSSVAPIAIEQKRWYNDYYITRDSNGNFNCPFAGCNKTNKRRDQLWDHWKARHNDDPYRCLVWSVFPYTKSLIKCSNSEFQQQNLDLQR